jgi:hypothetical protein
MADSPGNFRAGWASTRDRRAFVSYSTPCWQSVPISISRPCCGGGAARLRPARRAGRGDDSGVDPQVGGELLATLREALSNVARHAQATRVDVEVVVNGQVRLRVADNGVGPPTGTLPAEKGLRNMGDRAAKLGGSLRVRRPRWWDRRRVEAPKG